MLGELSVRYAGQPLALPRSRKTRALLAYLAITGREHRREHLCDLFWDVADDRRAALRWSLSKLRAVLDAPDAACLRATRTHVQLELVAGALDLEALRVAARNGFETQATEVLRALADGCRGELLEGLLLPDFEAFEAWCEAERAEARALHSRLRRTLVERLAADPQQALPHARAWLASSGGDEARRCVERLSVALGSSRPALATARADSVAQAPRLADSAPAAVPSPERPLVGRERETALLGVIVQEVRTQRAGRVVLVLGEPGMGKTRLLEELRHAHRQLDPWVLEGTCHEVERNRPLAPFLDATRQALAELQLGAAAPDRDQLFESLSAFVRRGTEQQGLGFLLLDDAHLCDPSSSELLHYVVRMAARLPLLTVVACRPAELEDNVELTRALAALRRRVIVEELRLPPLDAQALRSLVAAESPSDAVDRLVADSAGNPLLALEMARSNLVEGAVPRTLADLVLTRLSGLPASTRALVRWAAVMEWGPIAALQDACCEEVVDFVGAFETAARYGLVRLEPALNGSDSFAMAHSLIQRVVYENVSALRRAAMHRTAAEVLSKKPQGASRTSTIAYHASRADRPDLAARALIDGALDAAALGAVREAGELADRSLELLPRLEPEVASSVELGALLVLAQVRRPAEPARFVTRLTELGLAALDQRRTEEARRAFHAASHLRWEAGASHEGYGLARQAWHAAGAGDAAQRTRASSLMALCLALMEKQLPDAQALVHEAEALAQVDKSVPEPTELVLARGLLHFHAGRISEARRDATDAQLLARMSHNLLQEASALQMLLQLEHVSHQPQASSAAAQTLLSLSSKMREGGEGALAAAGLSLAEEDLGLARVGLEKALTQLGRLDDKRRRAWVANRWAHRERLSGSAEAALGLARSALESALAVEAWSEAAIAACELMATALLMSDDQSYVEAEAVLADCEARGTLSYEARRLIEETTTTADASQASQ